MILCSLFCVFIRTKNTDVLMTPYGDLHVDMYWFDMASRSHVENVLRTNLGDFWRRTVLDLVRTAAWGGERDTRSTSTALNWVDTVRRIHVENVPGT